MRRAACFWVLALAGCGSDGGGTPHGDAGGSATCGDGVCAAGEDPCGCATDCAGPCCGDGTCDAGEEPCTCPGDCPGACCGNGTCEAGEDSCACATDCQGTCCGDGACDAPEDACACAADCPGVCDSRYVFITSEDFDGTLDFAEPDFLCRIGAAMAFLPGYFVAWISTPGTSAVDQLGPSAARWSLPTGEIVANSKLDLTDGSLQHAIDRDEYGDPRVGRPWTNTDPDGTRADGVSDDCYDFTTNNPGVGAVTGDSTRTDSTWTNAGELACSTRRPLYCFEVPNPCAGVTCNDPPDPICIGAATVRTWGSPGWCQDGICTYPASETPCPDNNATPSCTSGVCGFTCDSGFGDCDGQAANACETDIRVDDANCGDCGAPCTDNALFCDGVEDCVAGGCVSFGLPACCTSCDEAIDTCDGVEGGSCLIEGVCYTDGEPDPANGCRECAVAVSQTAWTIDDFNACWDGLGCTLDDSCVGGACVGSSTTWVKVARYPTTYGIASLSDGSALLVGTIGTATFGEGEPGETALTAAGLVDLFVARYNADGSLAWARRAGNQEWAYARSVAAAPDGGALVTGHFEEVARFGAGEPGEITLLGGAVPAAFVARYNPDGTIAWARRTVTIDDPSGYGCQAVSIAGLPDGGAWVTGHFSGTVVFGEGEPGQTALVAGGTGFDMFLARFNADGTLVVAKQAGAAGGNAVSAMADEGAAVTGGCAPNAKFGGGEPDETTLPCTGRVFAARYRADGTLVWAKAATSAVPSITDTAGAAVATFADDSLVVAGTFAGPVTFGEGEPNETSLDTPVADDEMFVARYELDGTLAWVKRADSPEFDGSAGRGVAALADGTALVAGYFRGTTTFGGGEPSETQLVSPGFQDIFVARYNADGTLAWIGRAGGPGGDWADGIAALPNGRALVTGQFDDPATFFPGEPGETTLNTTGAFVARFCPGDCVGGDCDLCAGLSCDTPAGCYTSPGVCSAGTCTYAYDDGASCWDGNGCTTPDACSSGLCVGSPVSCSWAPTSSTQAPVSRQFHTAIWTGTEMVVWGGGHLDWLGGRYAPAGDTWVIVGSPSPTMRHSAVWTGSVMVVWGGFNDSDDIYRNTGSRYDPVTDLWNATNWITAPAGRASHTAVWTGTQMVVWGGQDAVGDFDTGGRYDPAADAWTPTSTTGAPSARSQHTAIWTGAEMIVWGGKAGGVDLDTGARYDPVADTWTPVSTTNAPAARSSHTAIWTGTEMIVWGGGASGVGLDTGGRYDPIGDTWTPTSTSGAPSARSRHTAVWADTQMIVWGGKDTSGDVATGGGYDPFTDAWTATPTLGAPEAREGHTAVWTGSQMIVWGGFGTAIELNTGGRLVP